jgi:hypothetical protein
MKLGSSKAGSEHIEQSHQHTPTTLLSCEQVKASHTLLNSLALTAGYVHPTRHFT